MFKGYLLLFASFLISQAVASEEGARVDVSDNACISAAIVHSEEVLLNTQPERWLLGDISMTGKAGRELLVNNLLSFQQFTHLLAMEKKRGERIPYTEITDMGDNVGTVIFYHLFLLYQEIVSYHEEVNNSITDYAINQYRQKMRFLLSDSDRGVDVNYQIIGTNFLMMAASDGHDDIVELLLEREVDLSYRPVDGEFKNQTVLTVTREALNRYESSSKDPKHIRVKKIKRYKRTIALLKEAGAADGGANVTFEETVWLRSFRSWF